MQAIMQKDGDSNGHQLDHVRELDHARKDSPTLFLPKPVCSGRRFHRLGQGEVGLQYS